MNTLLLNKQTVLVLGYVWPEPNSSAAGSHMLSLLDMFTAQNCDVTFASPAIQGDHKVNLTERGIKEQNIHLNCSSFDEFIVKLKPDLVLFDRFMLEEQFGWRVAKYCPDALRVLDTEDLHCLRHARHSALKQQRSMRKDDLNSDMAKREIAAIFRCDLSLIISDFELALLTNHFSVPENLLQHCPFMLATSELPQPSLDFVERQHFISIGNFRHAPNWDAVLFLKQSIWPLIRQQLPQAELHIYGAYPPPKATQLHNVKQGFLLKGWAQDAHVVMQQARVCLAPLRFGAGIKGKLAEAMMCGTPNVTTDIGAEGMSMGMPWPGLVTDTSRYDNQQECAIDFAENALTLYSSPSTWQHKQQLGYNLVQANFAKASIQATLLARIADIQGQLDRHRSNNFIGQMLQHHHLKSTQYMAQWIAAKNA